MKILKKKIEKYAFTLFATASLALMGCAVWLAGTQLIWIPLLVFSSLFLFFITNVRGSFYSFDKGTFIIAIAAPAAIGLVSTAYQFWSATVFQNITVGTLLLWSIGAIVSFFVSLILIKTVMRDIKRHYIKKRNVKEEVRRKKEKEQRTHEEWAKREEILSAIQQKGGMPEWRDVLELVACKGLTNEDWQCIIYACQYLSPRELLVISSIKETIEWKNRELTSALETYEIVFTQCSDDAILKKIQTQMRYLLSEVTDYYSTFRGYKRFLTEMEDRCPQLFAHIREMHMELA
ncbi:MAG TPA: hypothetical protein VGE18_00800 [Candidatus Paceibacterota bacterium]